MIRILIAALLLMPFASAPAADKIWSAVVLATRENPPAEVPRKLEDLAPTLRKVFGYNSFYLLGEKTETIRSGETEWLVPSRRIYMRLATLESDVAGYLLRIELFNGEELLVTTEARLARDAPLYIRGPQWGKGQIIAILEIR